MMGLRLASDRVTAPMTSRRAARPAPEHLEARLLLYSTLGAEWTYDSRITYSFMPDGTSVGGTSSALFRTMNAVAPTATWESQIEQAASIWETAANVNLALVPDGGEPSDQRRSTGRPAVRRHPHRRHPAVLGHPRRDLPASAGQWRHRRRRHPVQLHRQLGRQRHIRPDDRGGPRVRPCPGTGRVVRLILP